ncbi:macro domain-like protein [Microthyrium microscopicum]|uniref:Macro domain-like protein n=1 Tax=Microthyrium microscopicum TaxID=703497 RepID=A0A6A6UI41_9PEZI|nr:macro domain-like protein [Microthyrium microscopicum]
MSSSSTSATTLPRIHLLTRFASNATAFKSAIKKYYPALNSKTNITVHTSSLARLPATVTYDAIVSPANSYGFMDGAFDDAISILLSPNPRAGYGWTTRKVQSRLYETWRGYAPPGSCTVVDVRRDAEWWDLKRAENSSDDGGRAGVVEVDVERDGVGQQEDGSGHKHECKYIALCPTMRVPRRVLWDREVVFECVWALLCAIDVHNRQAREGERIDSILMTPLATGVGRVSEERWAAQCVLAMKYWVEAVEQPDKWGQLEWNTVYDESSTEIDATHDL